MLKGILDMNKLFWKYYCEILFIFLEIVAGIRCYFIDNMKLDGFILFTLVNSICYLVVKKLIKRL